MGLLDVVAGVTPEASDEDQAESAHGLWFEQKTLEGCFAAGSTTETGTVFAFRLPRARH
jgi:hypothetical protein